MGEQVLDHGYVNLIETWGSDERIIEAARMSTDKGFLGWGPMHTKDCPRRLFLNGEGPRVGMCSCKEPGDEKLLKYLYKHHHTTPFEMAGATFEIQAPIFVFREWHRHRTQSYNEMSARYIPLPDVNYVPTIQRIIDGANSIANKQAVGTVPLSPFDVTEWLDDLPAVYAELERCYQKALAAGVPKEIARLIIPVGRYSRMRASANLLNWIRFLRLRAAPNAQWEIRQYAEKVSVMLETKFPRTMHLFLEEQENAGRN